MRKKKQSYKRTIPSFADRGNKPFRSHSLTLSLSHAFILFALCLLTLPALAQAQTIKWLIVPVKDLSGEGPAGIETAVTRALAKQLGTIAGWKMRIHDANAPLIQEALERGMLTDREAASVPDLAAAYHVGMVQSADTVLLPVLTRQDRNVILVMNIIGISGRQSAGPGKKLDFPTFQATTTDTSTADSIAQALTGDIAAELAALMQAHPGLWDSKPEYAVAWAEEAAKLRAEGKYREASLAFQAAVNADPDTVDFRRQLAQTLLALGRTDDARRQLEQVLKNAPKDAEALIAMGEVYLAVGNAGRAITQFESAALVAKTDIRPRAGLARARLALGNVTYAVKTYEQLVKEAPNDPALHRGYGEALLQANQPDKALAEFRAALALDPGNIETRTSLANMLMTRGKLAEGVAELRQATDQSQVAIAYSMPEYRRIIRSLAAEADAINSEFEQRLTQYMDGVITQPQFQEAAEKLHRRSDNLARLLERISPPQELDRSHRYWVLAANLLNQSDFEATRYANNDGDDHLRRAQMFREASRDTIRQARSLAASERSVQPVKR